MLIFFAKVEQIVVILISVGWFNVLYNNATCFICILNM